jgi:phosphatidylserine/phosphatidylglycerophosphate/cardiolipin synthase-like enzyme/regulation of enolase protein 1 (concanavalin A-like superfamily)
LWPPDPPNLSVQLPKVGRRALANPCPGQFVDGILLALGTPVAIVRTDSGGVVSNLRTGLLRVAVTAAISSFCLVVPRAAEAQLAPQERLCDPSFENCRTDLLTYIKQEQVGIDAAFWLMSDDRYVSAIIGRWQAGVPVRLLVDPRCDENHVTCTAALDKFRAAGVPMRYRATSGILHWKMMLFAGQGQLEFSGANYNPFEFVPVTPYVNYTDEIVYYTDDAPIVQSFMTKFDDLWTSTTEFKDYANITTPLARNYDTFPISPDLNFPPDQSYRSRAVGRYNAETQKIDVMMFRITDVSHTNAIVKAVQRGVPVRLITDESEYRNPDRLWDAYNVDIMYHAGVQVRLDAHEGIDHAKLVLLYQQGMAIFGSSNWTSPSSDSQREHNYFTTKATLFNSAKSQFNREWSNSAGFTETKAFVPLPPTKPSYVSPSNAAAAVPTTGASLKWNGGLWAHVYDVYFGTSSNPPLVAHDLALGPSQTGSDNKTYSLPVLQAGTVYYWKIVSKTMAGVTATGLVWSFTTEGTSGGGGSLPSPWVDADVGAVGAPGSASFADPTFTVTGAGDDVWGTADAFHFVYQTLDGDGTIVARVASVQNTAAWAKAGVMIRSSLSAGSAQAFMLVSAGKGVAFQRRLSNGATSLSTAGSASTAPRWVKLTRSGDTIRAYESSNGTSWTQVGSNTFSMPGSVLIGLAVSSHVSGVTCTTTFDGVSVTASAPPPPPLPSGWDDADVGAVGGPGKASFAGSTFSVTGQGADIWGTADAFNYAYRTVVGDTTIIARVATVQNVNAWTKAGVMIRESLSPGAAHAYALVSASKGVAFQRRPTTGGVTVSTAGTLSAVPRWVKLTRVGNVFRAYESSDGSTWSLVGTETISMNASVLVGLAVTSHSTSPATATFDGVAVQ